MTVFGCADVREHAPELALDVLSGPDRAAALAHVSECMACRSLLAELTEAVDVVPFLVAEAAPPPGFHGRVLEQMTAPARPPRRRWPALLAAAAVAVTLVVTATAVFAHGAGRTTRTAAAGHVRPAAGVARQTAMVGAGGEAVGRLFVTSRDPAVMMVSVDYPIPSGTYGIEQRISGGSTRRLGDMQVNSGHGAWGGVTAAASRGSVELVDARGVVLCQASIPAS